MPSDATGPKTPQQRLKARAESSIAATRLQQIQANSERLAWSKLLWRAVSIMISIFLAAFSSATPVKFGLVAICCVIFLVWLEEEQTRRIQTKLLYELTRQSESRYVDEIDEKFINLQYDYSINSAFSQSILRAEPLLWMLLQFGIISFDLAFRYVFSKS